MEWYLPVKPFISIIDLVPVWESTCLVTTSMHFTSLFRYVWIMDYCRFWSSGMPCSILRVFGDSIQFHWGFGEFFIILCVSMWALFLYCVGPIHRETNLREAISSLGKVKGSLLGGVLFELLTRVVPQGFRCQQNWRKSAKFAYASLPMRELSSMDTQSHKELMQLGFIKCRDQDPWFVRILVTGQGIL